jgi:hypothetical protein
MISLTRRKDDEKAYVPENFEDGARSLQKYLSGQKFVRP